MKLERSSEYNSNPNNDAASALIRAGKEAFAVSFGCTGQDFDSPCWDVSHIKTQWTKQNDKRIYFTYYGSTDRPLPTEYAHVIKSWVMLTKQSITNMKYKAEMARLLWEAIQSRRAKNSQNFHWDALCVHDLTQAELIMREIWSNSTTRKAGTHLLSLVDFLAAHSICRPLQYTLLTPRIEDTNRHTIVGQDQRQKKLPTTRALEGLADIYSTLATEPADCLRAAAIAILVVTGFRIGELLTLPEQCEIEEVRKGKARYGLRYYKEKFRRGEQLFDVRWLPSVGAELARKAIAEIRDITVPFRKQAQILEQNPGKVPIPGFQWTDIIRPADLAEILGLSSKDSLSHISRDQLPRYQDTQAYFYRVFEVEAYLLSRRVGQLWTKDRRDGTYQMLSETLLIAPRNFFHAQKGTIPLLIEPINIQHISDFIGGRLGSRSAFARFNICEPDGSVCQMTTHQFRHWLNDIADKGGLPLDLQTRWFGRDYPKDTRAYHHSTAEERKERTKAGIRSGILHGTIANIYWSLPLAERDDFLEGQIQAAHATALGVCIHDFAISPCPYHLNCVRGCADYLRTKGDQRERKNLLEIKWKTEIALEASQKQAEIDSEIAQSWIIHAQETLDGINAALAVDNEPSVLDGDMIRPFNGRPSRFQPS